MSQIKIAQKIFIFPVGYCNSLLQISGILAQLDVLCSFAVVSACAPKPYVRPSMQPKGTGVLKLKQARHPCLEQLDHVLFIPNDVDFSGKFYFNIVVNLVWHKIYITSLS